MVKDNQEKLTQLMKYSNLKNYLNVSYTILYNA